MANEFGKLLQLICFAPGKLIAAFYDFPLLPKNIKKVMLWRGGLCLQLIDAGHYLLPLAELNPTYISMYATNLKDLLEFVCLI
ncbi:hypothetical protein AAF134_14565 [Synechococcus lacustris Tous-12m]